MSTASSDPSASRAAYLIAELTVRDSEKLARYAAEVRPMMARYGGRIISIDVAPTAVEGDWHPEIIALHHWRSRADAERFLASAEYQPLLALRHEACESRIVVVTALEAD